MALETFSIRFFLEIANRKRQFTVTRLQFHVNSASNFNKAFVVWWHLVVFRQVVVLHFNRLRNIKNSVIWVQTSNGHITGECRDLSLAFKREAVQFLMAKKLPINHFPLEALPAFQDCGHVTFSGLSFAVNHEKRDALVYNSNKINQVAVTLPL